MHDRYESPLITRYASVSMQQLFSAQRRAETWRRLWLALAKAEHELGLPITEEQIRDLEAHLTDIDFDCISRREKEVRHDVMAHIYAYGKAAPSAAGIIHLGATSCYVTDNGDLILYREGLRMLRDKLRSLLAVLVDFADRYKALPTLGYTHYQPAQLVNRRETGHALDAGPDFRSGGAGLCSGQSPFPRLPRYHRNRSELSGSL